MARILVILFLFTFLNSLKCASQLHIIEKPDSTFKIYSAHGLPQNFYTLHMGYFCKKELQIQKALSLPFFFRLGSKNYVDIMEGKLRTNVPAGY